MILFYLVFYGLPLSVASHVVARDISDAPIRFVALFESSHLQTPSGDRECRPRGWKSDHSHLSSVQHRWKIFA